MISQKNTETMLEKIMRFSPSAIALSLSFAMISSASIGMKSDDDINPLSLSILAKGDAAASNANFEEAVDLYETALAVDPRNRAAYVAMARAVKAKGLNGKAIRFYREALEIDPNDQLALTEQAGAMLAKGATEQAKANLARLQILCKANCKIADRLALDISKAGQKPTLQASAIAIEPVVGEAVPKKN
jgi:tetratricopeptide (TPR) repeat protein